MTFLLYFVPGAIAIAGSFAYYIYKDRFISKLFKCAAISFYIFGGLYHTMTVVSMFNDLRANLYRGSIEFDINYKLLISAIIYVVLGVVFSKLANKFDSNNFDSNNKEDKKVVIVKKIKNRKNWQ